MIGPKRILMAAATTLAVGMGAGVALVAAHPSNEPTKAGISTTSFGMTGAIVGTVASETDRCFQERKVRFLRKRSGKDRLLGTEKTEPDGKAYYLALDGLPEAPYYVDVKRSFLKRTAQHKHTCGKARSGAVEFGFPPPGP